jgi:hypothetical protein
MSRKRNTDLGFVLVILVMMIALIVIFTLTEDDNTTSEEPQSMSSFAPSHTRELFNINWLQEVRTKQALVASRDQYRQDPLEAALKYHKRLKTLPTPSPSPISTPTQVLQETSMVTNDGLNWEALAACESGGSPTIVSSNGLWYGLYQFTVGTWQGVGGVGLPTEASVEEQTKRAQILYKQAGDGPWPVCGVHLYD